jgi:putative spermidine/putrescine transport system permease protein
MPAVTRRTIFFGLAVPCILAAAVLVAALFYVFQYSFFKFIPGSLDVGGLTFENFLRLEKPVYLDVILDTFLISALTAIFCLLLSYPVAYAIVRTSSEGLRTFLIVLSVTPLFTGEIVRTYAWILVLGAEGFLNSVLRAASLSPVSLLYTKAGVVMALVHFSMPVMIVLLATAISHVNRDFEKAAANLGARPFTVFLKVTLPLSLPGVVGGAAVIFAWTMSAFSTPQLIGGGKVLMISNLVYLQGFSSFNFPFAAVLSLVAFAAAIGSLALFAPLAGRLERKLSGR